MIDAASSRSDATASQPRTGWTFVIGVDVGGTFTDCVCSDGVSTWRVKAPTSPVEFGEGVLAGCALIAEQVGLSLHQLLGRTERFGLGTTAVTNVLATKRGRTVGLITTAGFENHLHAMRNQREVVDGWVTMPWNPVHPEAVRGIAERIDRQGTVLEPIDPDEVAAAARDLVERQGVNAFAVSFIWAVRNPDHERVAVAAIRALYPELPVFSGVELHPIMREYERTSLAVLNAFTCDALDGVEELEAELKRLGLSATVLLLHSGGGAITVREARANPLGLASSGPAAGAVAAAEVALSAGLANALCCDMGGTSIDVALVNDGVPERRHSAKIGGFVTGQSAIDVESIGAGGGSVAWIDDRKLLRVGPRSARATPGPVCYGRGGTEPTVTDAMVLLGYIDAAGFLGGAMSLDLEAAHRACERLGRELGLSAIETAYGIREIALAEMGRAMQARISTSGVDVRTYGVVAFGGSGSLFAASLAEDLGLAWVLTPPMASVLSAYGAATADIQIERRRAIDELLPQQPDAVEALLDDLKAQVDAVLLAQGARTRDRRIRCEVDLRFLRQQAALTLAIDDHGLSREHLLRRFQDAYAHQYGEGSLLAQTPVELSTIRAIGFGKTVRALLPTDTNGAERRNQLAKHDERAVFLDRNIAEPIPVYAAAMCRPGHVIDGPALIDSGDTTLWAPPGAQVEVTSNRSFLTRFKVQA